MKTVLLFIGSFFALNVFSQNTANLTISTTGNTNLKITFNGKKYSLQDRSVTFQSLSPGNYNLTIFQLQKKNDGRQEYVNVFDRSITLSSQKHLEVSVLRFGKTAWDENYIERDEWNQSYDNPQPVSEQDYYEGNGNMRPVSKYKFDGIKKVVTAEYNEDERIKVVQLAMKNNWFTTSQIKEICKTFYNEDKMLTVAKYAYDFCVDKGSYITLGDMFYSSNIRRQLMDFIASK